jgi:hypothetical protein
MNEEVLQFMVRGETSWVVTYWGHIVGRAGCLVALQVFFQVSINPDFSE